MSLLQQENRTLSQQCFSSFASQVGVSLPCSGLSILSEGENAGGHPTLSTLAQPHPPLLGGGGVNFITLAPNDN